MSHPHLHIETNGRSRENHPPLLLIELFLNSSEQRRLNPIAWKKEISLRENKSGISQFQSNQTGTLATKLIKTTTERQPNTSKTIFIPAE